jgi:chaperonin GroEL (HSP60 family)
MQFPPAPLRAVLINGDITEDFKHVGFKDSFQTKRVFDKKSYNKLYTNDTSWLQRIIEVLQRLNIGAVFARGIIDKDLEDYCQTLNIQTFSSISSKMLQLLSSSLCSTTVVYLLDLQESDIGRPVLLRQWEGSQLGAMDTASFVILEVVHPVNNSDGFRDKGKKYKENKGLLQTVLLCGSSEQLLMDLELAFWNCVFCLRNAVNCGRVLPGAGRTELACIKKLRELCGKIKL